MKIGLNAGFS